MENSRDISKNFEQREKADSGSSYHTLKLALGDGRQTVRLRTSLLCHGNPPPEELLVVVRLILLWYYTAMHFKAAHKKLL